MDKKRIRPEGSAYRPGQPGAADETPEGVARGVGGAKISPSEPRAAPAGTDAEAADSRVSSDENIVNLENRRSAIGTDPDRTQAGGYEGRDSSRIHPMVAIAMLGAIVIIALVLVVTIFAQS